MILIRPYAHARDLAECLRVWRSSSEVGHPFLDRPTLDADEIVVREKYMPAAEIFVAETDGKIVGFIALLEDFVGGLFVDPSHHRQGVGRLLIAHAAARRNSLEVEVYEANGQARAFYAACGFVETGRRERDEHDRPLPLIRMWMPTWPDHSGPEPRS